MKKTLSLIFCTFFTSALFAQSSVGLVAHWDMNGSASDVTGNGHNGNLHYVIPVAGMDGVPNTAYYFNGSNSFIGVPYASDLNLTEFSICATVKILGFNSGLCQGNYIIARGAEAGTGNWSLRFDDNAFNDCYAFDSTKEVFISTAGSNTPSYAADWQYVPPIVRDTWYKVIVTYKAPVWKIYIDCKLVNTATGPGMPMGSDMDSVVMGMNIWQAGMGYPYPFKGAIDDIRLYNRALPDSEIFKYCDTCGYVSSQPTDVVTTTGSTATFSVATTIAAPSYQWQRDSAGSGFTDISNGGIYSGTNTNTLVISGVPISMNGNHFRCKVNNEVSCDDISSPALLAITTGVNDIISAANILLYPNPVSNKVVIVLPVGTNGQIEIINELGLVQITEQIVANATNLDISSLPSGAYIVRIYTNGQTVYKKMIKI